MNPETDDKKGGLIRRSKELLDTAMGGLKGRDMNALMDEFTQEMTVVADSAQLNETYAMYEREADAHADRILGSATERASSMRARGNISGATW